MSSVPDNTNDLSVISYKAVADAIISEQAVDPEKVGEIVQMDLRAENPENNNMHYHTIYLSESPSALFSECELRHPTSSRATSALINCTLQPLGFDTQSIQKLYDTELLLSIASAHGPIDAPFYLVHKQGKHKVSYGFDRNTRMLRSLIINISLK